MALSLLLSWACSSIKRLGTIWGSRRRGFTATCLFLGKDGMIAQAICGALGFFVAWLCLDTDPFFYLGITVARYHKIGEDKKISRIKLQCSRTNKTCVKIRIKFKVSEELVKDPDNDNDGVTQLKVSTNQAKGLSNNQLKG